MVNLPSTCKTLTVLFSVKGFHRYSTDEHWHVPHFEKMLYDQGQLAVAYADCFAITKDTKLKGTLDKMLEYVCRDLQHPVRCRVLFHSYRNAPVFLCGAILLDVIYKSPILTTKAMKFDVNTGCPKLLIGIQSINWIGPKNRVTFLMQKLFTLIILFIYS